MVLKSPLSSPDQPASLTGAAVQSLQERKQKLVRDTIWDTAIDLFARKGFIETTVDEIAQAAGTSRRSFFRYFESKSDLMAQAIVSYGTALTEAIESCPSTDSLSDVLRQTVRRIALQSAAQPRTREIMEIAAKYPAARDAQMSRMAEVQDLVAAAFARRCAKDSQGELAAHVLAALTLSMVGVVCHAWFNHAGQDISVTAEQAFATLGDVVCGARRKAEAHQ